MTTAIELHARKTRGFDARVAHAVALLREAAEDHAGRIVQATSLGVEGMVLTDLIARHRLPIAVATLDTGKLHAADAGADPAHPSSATACRWRCSGRGRRPSCTSCGRHGERAMFDSVDLRKGCCDVRKLEPMQRLLPAAAPGSPGCAANSRSTAPRCRSSSIDADGREKFYPLADWSEADVWHYVPPTTCPTTSCTTSSSPASAASPARAPSSLGEDARAGRWWWEQEGAKECGLHAGRRAPRP